MRVTLGKTVRAFVYRAMLGDNRLQAICHGEEQIWPTLADTVRSCILDVAAIEGSAAGAYFAHALRQLELLGAASGRCVLVVAGGRTYSLNGELPGYDVVRYDAGVLDFGDEGPCADALRDGDMVALRLVMPQRFSESFVSPSQNVGFERSWDECWLPGTVWQYAHWKGQKKVCSWASGYVDGVPSGVRYLTDPWHNHPGHWRGDSWHSVVPVEGFVPDYNDRALRCHMDVGGSSGVSVCRLVFPAFYVSLNLAVASVTLHG
ncbi:MAG: hypothetical protein ACI4O9_08130 [Akkermansia sp.]